MVQLFIDNIEMMLSQSINIKIKKVSQLVDEEKDNAFNIELPISQQVIEVFGYINRIDFLDVIVKHKGEIRYNNIVIISGDVFIVKFNENSLTIQIVETQTKIRVKSEDDINFGGGDRLDRLVFDTVPLYSQFKSWAGFPYTCDSISIPALYVYDDTCFPIWSVHASLYYFQNTYNIYSDDTGKILDVPFPSLYKTLEQVITKNLHYKIRNNFLIDNDFARRLFIAINVGYKNVYKWGDYLPAWSVAKFLMEIEKLFNVFIYFNTKDRTCDIISRAAKSLDFSKIDVFDNFECEYDENAVENTLFKYNFTDHYYYQLADINDFSFNFMVEKISEPKDAVNFSDFPTKFKLANKDKWYILDQDKKDYSHDALLPLNNYIQYGNSESKTKTEFNIIPAIHTCLFYNTEKYVTIPFLDNYDKPEDTAYFSAPELIKANIDETTSFNNDDKLRIALYAGYADALPYIAIPFSVNKTGAYSGYPYGQTGSYNKDLSLKCLIQEFGHNTINLENKIYKFTGKVDSYQDIYNYKVLIRNKLYLLKSITYTLTASGFDSLVDIEAIPLKEQS